MQIESREVLAGAYVQRPVTMLRHAVMVDDTGRIVKVFCRRVTVDNLADRHAGDPTDAPTCPQCLRALRVRPATS